MARQDYHPHLSPPHFLCLFQEAFPGGQVEDWPDEETHSYTEVPLAHQDDILVVMQVSLKCLLRDKVGLLIAQASALQNLLAFLSCALKPERPQEAEPLHGQAG